MKNDILLKYRTLNAEEVNREIFKDFIRYQNVTKCWRKENGKWIIKDAPFIDDWTEKDYQTLIFCLKNTIASNGFVYAAFYDGKLKGFVSVESEIFGGKQGYCDLSSIHISEDMRRKGIGRTLFLAAKEWAKQKGAKKLYISAHSAVESQLMHDFSCTDAKDMNYKILADRVRYFKEDEKGVETMCKSMEEMRNEASRAKAVQIARRMLDSGKLTYEEIAEFSDLTIEEVKTLDEKQPA